jgi:hypothetical protein
MFNLPIIGTTGFSNPEVLVLRTFILDQMSHHPTLNPGISKSGKKSQSLVER